MAKKPKDEIIKTAHKRFALAASAESDCRKQRADAIRFSRLMDQWPDAVKKDRQTPGAERPMLTIPRHFQFRNQIINEIRANSPSIKVRPVGDDANDETAEIIQGVIRHIQDQSSAETAYDTACEAQVDGGLGYFRILTDYIDSDSFDQDIFIKRVEDPFKVYCGPYVEPDGSDMCWAFIVTEVQREDFEAEYPDVNTANWRDGGTGDAWYSDDTVRVAEYFELSEQPAELIRIVDGTEGFKDELEAKVGPIPHEYIDKSRKVSRKTCLWRKLGGDTVLGETEIPCSYVPIIPVIGNEVWVEGKRHLHGITQLIMDAQRQYNYLQSANTEFLALAPRSPFIAAEGQLEGHEAEWASANRINLSVLTYNPVTVAGSLAPAPQRQQPPGQAPGFESGMMRAEMDMKACAGIFDASLGKHEGDQSGRAIQSQQQQASIGNFHFSDNLKRALKHAGRIIVEMGFTHPKKVYDTPRVMRILGEDGIPSHAKIDPNQPQAMQEVENEQGEIEKVFNPGVGKYDIVVDTGPSYMTKRQEAVGSMLAAAQVDPQLLQIAGDIVYRNMDWPGADEIAERKKLALPPQLQQHEGEDGKPEDPRLAQVAQQMNMMADQMQHMSQALQEAMSEKELKEREMAIKEFEAVTRRMETEAKISTIPGQVHGIALDNLGKHLAMNEPAEPSDESAEQEQAEAE